MMASRDIQHPFMGANDCSQPHHFNQDVIGCVEGSVESNNRTLKVYSFSGYSNNSQDRKTSKPHSANLGVKRI